MNFACHQCERRYSIADEKVRGRTVKVRCKACQTVITVQGDLEPPEESTKALSVVDVERLRAAERAIATGQTPPPPPPAPAPDLPSWFVMVRGSQQGPWGGSDLAAAVRDGRLTPRSFCWKEGMADWQRAAELPELAPLLPKAAPQPMRASDSRPAPEVVPPTTGRQPALEQLFDEPLRGPATHASPGVASSQTPVPSGRSGSRRADPFAQLTEGDGLSAPAPGEATQFFMAQAGVTRRNPPSKIALSLLLGIGLPVGLLYLLSITDVVPLTVKRVDAVTGEEVETQLFSSEGVSGLKEKLLGGGGPKPAPVVPAKPPSTVAHATSTATPPKAKPAAGTERAAALYALDEKEDVGPVARKAAEVTATDGLESGGPPADNIARVVGDRQKAFQDCVEQELRKNPSFRGGKVALTVTLGSSGAVRSAALDRRDLDSGTVGECLKSTARKMLFASFSGEDVQVVIPLVLTSAN